VPDHSVSSPTLVISPLVLYWNNQTSSTSGTPLRTTQNPCNHRNRTMTSTIRNSLPLSMPLKPSVTTLKAIPHPLKSGWIIITLHISEQNNTFPDAKPAGPFFYPNSRSPLSINPVHTTKRTLCLGVQTLKRGYFSMKTIIVCFWTTNFSL
jgi:hypothetical protein